MDKINYVFDRILHVIQINTLFSLIILHIRNFAYSISLVSCHTQNCKPNILTINCVANVIIRNYQCLLNGLRLIIYFALRFFIEVFSISVGVKIRRQTQFGFESSVSISKFFKPKPEPNFSVRFIQFSYFFKKI